MIKLEDLLEIFIPQACLYCGLYENRIICSECEKKLVEYMPESFLKRKRSKNWEQSFSDREKSGIEKAYYFYRYNEIIHNLITSIKYNFQKNKVQEVIRLIKKSKEFQEIDFSQFNYLTYVPSSKNRMNWRGFNHSRLIADELSKLLQIPYFQILQKVKETKAQIDLEKEERITNLQDTFKVCEKLPVTLLNEKILLIDDICTTGSTLIECARTIKKIYPDLQIFTLCLARGK